MDDLADYVKEEMPINIFYRVSESIVGINEDPEKIKSFHWDEDFKGTNLSLSRKEALEHYGNRRIMFNLEGISKDFFNLSYSSPDEFIAGQNYAYSIYLKIIALYGEDDVHEYCILGEDEDETEEGKNFEIKFCQESGYSDEQIFLLGAHLYYEEILIDTIRTFSIAITNFKKLPMKEKLKYFADNLKNGEKFNTYLMERSSSIK